jgi:hydrogenase/urease accessory protein HupE
VRLAVAALAACAIVAAAAPALAHPLEPSSLQIDESRGVATFESPDGAELAPVWPAGCTATPTGRTLEGAVVVERFALDCAGRGLAGAELGIDGLADRDTIALVRVRLAGGGVARDVLGPAHPRFTVPADPTWTPALAAYARLGIAHLLGGLDHVLFVLGLLFVVRGARARFVTLTAFTAGHAITLALAVIGVVRVPAAPVEVAIALTLIVLAVQVLDRDAAPTRRAWLLAAGFGLVHGLGFASALTGAGLEGGDVPLALAGFHLGLELAQLALVAAALLLAAAAAPLVRRAGALAPLTRWTAGHAIGALAAMWCLERL